MPTSAIVRVGLQPMVFVRDVREAADERLSTGGMCRYARESTAKTILVGTEVGLLHRLRQENPEKTFVPVSEALV